MLLLADADVLIDYRDSELDVLRLVSRHMAPMAVVSQVLAQVRGLKDPLARRRSTP